MASLEFQPKPAECLSERRREKLLNERVLIEGFVSRLKASEVFREIVIENIRKHSKIPPVYYSNLLERKINNAFSINQDLTEGGFVSWEDKKSYIRNVRAMAGFLESDNSRSKA